MPCHASWMQEIYTDPAELQWDVLHDIKDMYVF